MAACLLVAVRPDTALARAAKGGGLDGGETLMQPGQKKVQNLRLFHRKLKHVPAKSS